MKNLAKVIQIAKADHKNWRHELTKFLHAYRATPHSMTGVPPAALMFNGRRYRTNLPSVQPNISPADLQARAQQNDMLKKAKMKETADGRGNVQVSGIRPGDKVLLKQKKQIKLTTAFETLPYTVRHVKGSQVTASNELHQLTRHANDCKKLPPVTADLDLAPEPATVPSSSSTTTSSEAATDIPESHRPMAEQASPTTAVHWDDHPSQQASSEPTQSRDGVTAPLRRSGRNRQEPARYPAPDRQTAL
jgi:hypothetical protein